MNRGNRILVVLLVVQLVLVAVVFWPQTTSQAAGEPLLAGLDVDRVLRMTIRDESGESIELATGGAGWVLAGSGDYPCRENVVPDFVTKLSEFTSDRLVTQTRDSHRRLKVAGDEYAYLIELESDDGTLHRLYVGTFASYNVAHVRVDRQDQVYLASGISSGELSVVSSTWIDTSYLTLAQEQVTAITLENTNGTFEFARGADGLWMLDDLAADETLNQNNVNSLLSRVSSIRMLRPLGTEAQPSYGLEDPAAVVTIRTESGEGAMQIHTLYVGAQDPQDNSYTIKSSDSPYYVQVTEYTVQDLIDRERDAFLELPPTPEEPSQ